MTAWPVNQLDSIDRAEELEVITVRPDGTTRRPVPIWVVRVSDDIFVRSYRGEDGAWYRHALADGAGRVRVADLDQAVTFEPITSGDGSEAIDAAYRAKYSRYGDRYVKPMVVEAARAATLRVTPRDR
jgi:hypothetical protein